MPDKVPIYREISTMGIAVIISVYLLAVAGGYVLGLQYSPIAGYIGAITAGLILVAYAFWSRRQFAGHNTIALRMVKRGEFEQAIETYQKSLDFFARYPWLDRFRFITMMSTSTMTYREIALISQAYCYIQLQQTDKARALYEQCLREYPQNILAASTLRFMDAVKNEAAP